MYNPLYFRLKQIITIAKFYEDLYFSTEAAIIRLQAEELLRKCLWNGDIDSIWLN